MSGALEITKEQYVEKRSDLAVGLLASCVLALAACGEEPGDIRPIAEVREVELLPDDQPRQASVAERFGFGGQAESTTAARVDYELPPGWEELAPNSLRTVNLRVAGDERAECYLTFLPGDAGGLVANVNRWCKQMSVDPLGPEALDALPRARLLGRDAFLFDTEGTFTAGDEIHENWRLVGLLAFDARSAVFLKMTGPRDVIERELGSFHALARSLQVPAASASASGETDSHGGAGGLHWELPPGWRRGPDRSMRLANFLVGDPEPVECYIAVLGGTGGGVLANVNRWRGELGQDPIDEDGLAGLERLPILGEEGLLVQVEGPEGEGRQMMLGAICLRSDHAVFVKMTGPIEVVAPERAAFISFCKSLHESH